MSPSRYHFGAGLGILQRLLDPTTFRRRHTKAATLRLKNSANIRYYIYGLSLRHCLHRYGTFLPLAGQCLLLQCVHLWKVKQIIDRTLRIIMTTTNVPTIVPIDSKNTILAISSIRASPIWESLVSSAMGSSPGHWYRSFSSKSRLFAESHTTCKASFCSNNPQRTAFHSERAGRCYRCDGVLFYSKSVRST